MNAINKIRKLYQQNPNAQENFKGKRIGGNYIHTLDHYLNELEQDPPLDFSMQALDEYQHHLNLAMVLAHLPAEVIHIELGDDALMWTWVKYPYSTQKDVVAEGIQRVTGRDPERIEKARLTAWQLLQTSKAGLVKSIYDLNEQVLGGITETIDLPNFLQRNAKSGVKLSPKRLNNYSLDPLTTEGTNSHGYEITWEAENNQDGDKRFSIYLDSPVGLTLTYKGEPNAVVGFFPNDFDTVMVYQLQGVRPTKIGADGKPIGKSSSRGLMPLNWQKLLVDVIEHIGQKLGYEQIGIQSGDNNSWTKPYGREGEIHLPLEEALKRYDGVAQKLGFQQAENKNWYRSLK